MGFDDFSFCVSIKKPGRVEDFYIKKIAEGVATLAASVYPKRIIVRLSDFKSNEYLDDEVFCFFCRKVGVAYLERRIIT